MVDGEALVATDREIPAVGNDRSPAPDRVWDYANFLSWREPVWSLVKDFATPPVRRAFLRRPPKYVVSDDLSWLEDIVLDVRHEIIDAKALLADRLRERYDAIRAVHGGRPTSAEPYYRDGLRLLDPRTVQSQARAIFLGGSFPEIDKSRFDDAVARVGTHLREGRIFFECNEAALVDHCGHYMIYGSEYLLAIAAHLKGGRDYRQVLRTLGRPTVFVCDVPLKLMEVHTLEEFAGCALEALFSELLEGDDFQPDWARGAGFCIYEPLPAAAIVGHYHPSQLWDPLGGVG